MQFAIPLLVISTMCAILGVLMLRLLIIGRRTLVVRTVLAGPMIFAFALAVIIAAPACSAIKKTPAAAKAAGAECLQENKDELFRLTLDALGQAARWLAAGQDVDWDALVTQAEARGTILATCVVVETWHELNKGTISAEALAASSVLTGKSGRVAIERLRARIGGGQWVLADGSKL
jgi:hypothetical protein